METKMSMLGKKVAKEVAEYAHIVTEAKIKAGCRAACQSGLLHTGQSTCAAACMDVPSALRNGSEGCPHALRLHGALVTSILRSISHVM